MDALFGLPDAVIAEISRQYRDGVAAAVRKYGNRQESEGAVSGMITDKLEDFVVGTAFGYRWSTKGMIFSPGPGASEDRYGADLILEISATTYESTRRKSLLVQSKQAKDYDAPRLRDQCAKLCALPGSHVVLQYSSSAFTAYRAKDVLAATGHWAQVPPSKREKVEDLLAGDFLGCTVGSFDVHYDQARRMLVRQDGTDLTWALAPAPRGASTTVTLTQAAQTVVRQGQGDGSGQP